MGFCWNCFGGFRIRKPKLAGFFCFWVERLESMVHCPVMVLGALSCCLRFGAIQKPTPKFRNSEMLGDKLLGQKLESRMGLEVWVWGSP